MKALQSPGIVISCLLLSLCLLDLPSVAASGTLVVLGVRLLQTSNLFS
jgi:hypothetical protein